MRINRRTAITQLLSFLQAQPCFPPVSKTRAVKESNSGISAWTPTSSD
ncbi:hypothetical protein [Puia dinghuensis]|nr:hypothetical protein [Puia dinghuensis]